MNKRYMDFVPKGKKIPTKKPVEVEKPIPVAEEPEVFAVSEEILIEEQPVVEAEPDVAIEEFLAVDSSPRRREDPEFGIIEDYKPKFVKTEITKRPLGAKPDTRPVAPARSVADVAAVKAKKIAARPFVKAPAVVPKNSEVAAKPAKEEALKVPKTRFVNTEKEEKRPHSKNV